VGGAALVALGFVCWRVRHDERSSAAVGVVMAMPFYNVAAVAILAYAWLGQVWAASFSGRLWQCTPAWRHGA
jgi:hypothetical protein